MFLIAVFSLAGLVAAPDGSRCVGSPFAVGDPYFNQRGPTNIDAIGLVLSEAGMIGYAYRTKNGQLLVQATTAMSASDRDRLKLEAVRAPLSVTWLKPVAPSEFDVKLRIMSCPNYSR